MNPPKSTLDDLRIERGAKPAPGVSAGQLALGLVVVLVIAAGVWWLMRPKPIAVHTAVAREITTSNGDRTVLNASGYVTARRAATASSKVTGKVVEVMIEESMKVKAGQILARLDDTNVKTSLDLAQAQLDSAKAAVEETRAQLKQADQEFKRTTALAAQKIASAADLDRAQSDADTLRARILRQERDVTVAERQLATWQQQIEDLIIRAPFDGMVTTKNSQPGEMISPISAGGGFTRTGIGTIVDMDSLEIEIDVNESFINRVQPGQPVVAALDAYSDWKIPCKVIAIIPTADRQKATVKVRVGFDRLDPRILPEMAAKVAFQESAGTAQTSTRLVSVPKQAVQQQDGRDVIFVVQNNRAERRAVTLSSRANDEVVVAAGVSAGDKVILDVPAGLAEGAMVKEARR